MTRRWWEPEADASDAFANAVVHAAKVGALVGLPLAIFNAMEALTTPDPDSTLYFGVGGTLLIGTFLSVILALTVAFGAFAPYLWFEADQAHRRRIGLLHLLVPAATLVGGFVSGIAWRPFDWVTSKYELHSVLWAAGYVCAASALVVSSCLFALAHWSPSKR